MKIRVTLGVTLLLMATALVAADTSSPVMVIRAAHLIDGRGTAPVSPGVVVVRGNRIESLGGPIPAGAQVIDLGDMTILPGLIDAHVHMLLQGDVTSEDYDVQLFKESMPYRALRASRAARIAYYITSGRRIILLTVSPKARPQERHEVARAERAMKTCLVEGHTTEEEAP